MKIEKIGDNHYQITKTKKIYDKNNKNKFVEVDGEPFEIGRKGIQAKIAEHQAMIDFYNDKEKVAEAKAKQEQEKSDWEDILNNLEE